MVRTASIFSQILGLVDRAAFHRIVRRTKANRYTKRFTAWDHFVSMVFAQVAQAKSLREVCDGLHCAVGKVTHLGIQNLAKRSTLSYANEHRSSTLFQELFADLATRLPAALPQRPKKPFRFKNKLLSLDSSVITLCLTLFPWAEYTRTKGGVKLHMLLDHDGYFPSYAVITVAKRADIQVARTLALPKGSIVAMDRGYLDYELFGRWTRDDGVFFVSRLKSNLPYKVLSERRLPVEKTPLRRDEVIQLTSDRARKHCLYPLRRVVVWDAENQRELVLLTNHMDFAADTIGDIYRERWKVELFFKALKQNLKVKTFLGTSRNALEVQLWTALIAMLLVTFLRWLSKRGWSLSNLVALLRWNLFQYKDLAKWLDDPFETPPGLPDHPQARLPGFDLGQLPKATADEVCPPTWEPHLAPSPA
ncbi:MAG: IS4 family transposase [Deferrisomatales bacterium]